MLILDLPREGLQLGGGKDENFTGPSILGASAILSICGMLVLWSVLAPLASAVVETGTVVVESGRKLVQHPEGGVVKRLYVSEGQEVALGQVLLDLDDTRQVATRDSLRTLLLRNAVQQSRLEAERERRSTFEYVQSTALGSPEEVQSVVAEQRQILMIRSASLAARLQSLEADGMSLKSLLGGEKAQLSSEAERFQLTFRELQNAQVLAASGAGTRQRALEVRRALADLQGSVASIAARIAETNYKVERAGSELIRVQSEASENVEAEIQTLLRDRIELTSKLLSVDDQISKLHVLAPATGTIIGLNVHTVGGIATANAILAEIVPHDRDFVIEAQVRPTDISSVTIGMPVDVRISEGTSRNSARVVGEVTAVSADRLVDQTRSVPFFIVRVRIVEGATAGGHQQALRPGLAAELFFLRGEKTLLTYLSDPFFDFFRNSLRE